MFMTHHAKSVAAAVVTAPAAAPAAYQRCPRRQQVAAPTQATIPGITIPANSLQPRDLVSRHTTPNQSAIRAAATTPPAATCATTPSAARRPIHTGLRFVTSESSDQSFLRWNAGIVRRCPCSTTYWNGTYSTCRAPWLGRRHADQRSVDALVALLLWPVRVYEHGHRPRAVACDNAALVGGGGG